MEKELAFISYLNDDDLKVNGYFEIVEVNGWKVSFKTNDGSLITIPYTRVLKIKEKLNKGDDYGRERGDQTI